MRQFTSDKAEQTRIRALYRRAAMEGRLRIPVSALKGLVGQDCAYHLYNGFSTVKRDEKNKP